MAAQLLLNQKPFIQLQIEALVEENQVKLTQVEEFFEKLKEKLLSIQEAQYGTLTNREFRLPLIGRPNGFDKDFPKAFKFYRPDDVRLIGSIKTDTVIKGKTNIDIAVVMPSKCIEKKDAKNQRYHRKRALYLCQLAAILDGSLGIGLVDQLEFRYDQGDTLKPVLVIIPKNNKLRKLVNFQIYITVDPNDCPFKTSILLPEHGNVAPKWFFQDYPVCELGQDKEILEFIGGETGSSSNPFYNSSILKDLELLINSDTISEQIRNQTSINEAIILIKIWLIQLGFQKNFSFIITMYVAHLQTKQIIHQNMSSFQIFKQIMKSIATNTDWSTDGMSYFDDSSDKITEFKKHFPVVFLSPSGNFNLCYNITCDSYQGLRHEAQLADRLLAEPTPEILDLLLLKKRDFYNKFDVIVHLPKCTQKITKSLETLRKYMDHGVFTQRVYSEHLLNLVKRALGDRVILLQQSPEHLLLIKKRWNIKSIPHDPTNDANTFSFGMLLDPEKTLRVIDVGPPANSPEAEEFRQFWEPKSQLRLQDGQISETVVWHVDSLSQRREIIKFILIHALKKLNINQVTVLNTFLEKLISLRNLHVVQRQDADNKNDHHEDDNKIEDENETDKNGNKNKRKRRYEPSSDAKPLGLGEANYQQILKSYNELNKLLRNLEDMKYTITGIQSISAHLRGTSEFPPLQVYFQNKNKALKRRKGATLFPEDFNQAGKVLHLDPIDILVTLEGSSKWPSELDALEAAKQSYLIQLTESLRSKSYTVKLADGGIYLDIMYGQFIYRIQLRCPKELSLISLALGKEEYQKRRFQMEIAPRVHEALQQLARERVAFCTTCRVVKRWLSCQLLTDHLSEMTIELLVAHLFISPEPFTEPMTSSCGFRRFLELISRHDWEQSPLIINFDGQIKMDEITRLRESMSDDRTKFPPMVVCTPFDKDAFPWTKINPNKEALNLLIRLCTKAYDYLNNEVLVKPAIHDEYKALFRPNFKVFNLLIKLKYEVVQNFFMSFDAPRNFILRAIIPQTKNQSAFAVMPIVGLNLVEQYVGLLRENYGHLAWFFYDKFGQRLIGVVMKPDSERQLSGDMSKFITDLKKLGSKLVDTITIVKKQDADDGQDAKVAAKLKESQISI